MSALVSAFKLLTSLCTPSRGGSPGFTPYHVIEALKLLSREPLGRIGLASRLGIGESSARTLIERLEARGLIARSRLGVRLTREGLELLELLSRSIRVYDVDLGELSWGKAKLIVVKGVRPPAHLVEVYKIRDYIVAEGCREVMIGGFSQGTLVYPGMPEDIWRIVLAKTPREALEEETLHVITPAGKFKEAFNGIVRMVASQS
jgi:DNA-binding Lrp family transcriptional regulator